MPLLEKIWDDMRSVHGKFHEFTMHIKGDISLSLFSFSEICTKEYYGSRIFEYMKMRC
jgi:hypothetical protein